MAFARIQTTILNHPKFDGLDPAAIGLWTMGNVYCWDQLTDGFIPRSQLSRLLSSSVRPNRCLALAELLVAATAGGRYKHGLWEHEGADFRVHDWLDHNPPRERLLEEREAAKLRMQQHRRARRSPERTAERSPERASEHTPRSPVRSGVDLDVDQDIEPPPNVRANRLRV